MYLKSHGFAKLARDYEISADTYFYGKMLSWTYNETNFNAYAGIQLYSLIETQISRHVPE